MSYDQQVMTGRLSPWEMAQAVSMGDASYDHRSYDHRRYDQQLMAVSRVWRQAVSTQAVSTQGVIYNYKGD